MLKLHNTATRKTEKFHPQDKNHVTIYTCGPTVYSKAHIGNLTAYIYWDLLLRTLIANGMTPYRVLNLTDVGHLTSDEDTGEDKMEKGAKKEGKTVWEIADFYIDAFLTDFRSLNLLKPNKICRATDYIEQDQKLIDIMTKNGFTYEASDGIYFDTSKFKNYADFAKLNLQGLKAGARVNFNPEKKNPSDFAVWMFIKPDEKHAMRWDFLDRPGYPGWHLECSTIIHEDLGETIDIHTGGIDHIPVHHTNEIAQTFAVTGKPLSNYWLHCNHITINGEKISKSLGNAYYLSDLEEKGFSPIDFKMWVLSGNYGSSRNFSIEDLTAAKNRRKSWRNKIALIFQSTPDNSEKSAQEVSEYHKQKILEAVNDNLNSAAAFAIIDNLPDSTPLSLWQFIDNLFGLDLIKSSKDISESQKQLINKRELARKNKDWYTSDALRIELEKTGISIKDTPSGPIWQYS